MNTTSNNRLSAITSRQKSSLLRDIGFVALLALAGVVSVTSVAAAAQSAHVQK